MLLYHDGFEGYGPNFEGSSYYKTSSSNVTVVDSGLRQGGKCLSLNKAPASPGGSFGTVALQATTDSDVLITGFRLNIPSFGVSSLQDAILLTIFSGTTTRQARLYRRNVDNVYFILELAFLDDLQNIKSSTVKTQPLAYGSWNYIELRIFFSNTGSAEIRVGGFTVDYNKALPTEANPGISRRWDRLLWTAGSETFRITDFYVNNNKSDQGPRYATFLGPVQSVRVWPRTSGIRQWAPHHGDVARTSGSQGIDLWVLAGQSNAHGTDKSPTPVVSFPSTNGFVQIWDRRHGGGVVDLVAGYNNNRQFMPGSPVGAFYGPEMSLAGSASDYFAANLQSPASPSRIVMVKGAQDASAIYPSIPDFTWHPDFPGNLYNDNGGIAGPSRGNLKQDILDTISALGGSSNIREMHVFWHQGESDGFFDFSVAAYLSNLNYLFDTIKADFPSLKITFHVVLIHKNLLKASAPNAVDGFWWTESIRDIQKIVVNSRSDCRLISMDDIPLAYDSIHFGNAGVNVEGSRMFASWLETVNGATLLDEVGQDDGTVSGLSTFADDRAATFGMAEARTLRGSGILAESTRIRGSAPSPAPLGLIRSMEDGSLQAGQQLTLPSSGNQCDGMRTGGLPSSEQVEKIKQGFTS